MAKIVFPLSNGVVIQQDEKEVVCATNCDGKKKLRSFKNKNKIIFWHFPLIRGIQYFFCGLFAFFQALAYSIDLCQPQVAKKSELNKYYKKQLIQICVIFVIAIVFSALYLGMLPAKLGLWLVDYKQPTLLRNAVIMIFKIGLFDLFLLFLRAFPMVNEMFRFNKASDTLTLKEVNTKSAKKLIKSSKKSIKSSKKPMIAKKFQNFFDEVSINFLNYVVFVFVLDFVVVTLLGASYGFWFNLALHLAIFLLSTAVAFELLQLISRFKILQPFRYMTAFLVFAKPHKTHFETVNNALTEISLLSTVKDREFMEQDDKIAFALVYNEVRNILIGAGVTDKSDADWLIATILNKNRAEIKLVPYVSQKQYDEIIKATRRRANGESLDNIFGWTEFYGIRFDVNKKVLTPRMETEILVEQVLNAQKNYKNSTILDVGTGSGAIAIALAKNCDAEITAVDVSKSALIVAENNAKKNGVKIEFLHSNLFENLKRKRKFDIIVSNPPYIPSKDISSLDKNVRECDPILALDGGDDGLDYYRKISKDATSRLKSNGMIFYEVGKGQAGAVRKILRENGFEDIKTIKDYNKIERIVCGKLR